MFRAQPPRAIRERMQLPAHPKATIPPVLLQGQALPLPYSPLRARKIWVALRALPVRGPAWAPLRRKMSALPQVLRAVPQRLRAFGVLPVREFPRIGQELPVWESFLRAQ